MFPHIPQPRGRAARARGFTLLEVLVTVAIIAVMASLLTPAVRGLMGVTGPRGGTNSLMAVMEQARLSAMQTGQTTFVGFPFGASDSEAAYSSVIVFRTASDEEQAEDSVQFVPVTRWIRMPPGVFIESDGLAATENVGAGVLPRLQNEEVATLNVIAFDRFGKLRGATTPVEIRVGQKAEPTGNFMPTSDQHFRLTVQPLTGRTRVVDQGKGQQG